MKVLFIQTGGTIDKDYPKVTKGYAFDISTPAIERVLPLANPTFEYEVMPLLQKDSQEITLEDREKIKAACLNSEYSKIIITHGTDTMIETGHYLKEVPKAIVITGAMRPERFSNSDASFNIGTALGIINMIESGVYICMNGVAYPIDEVDRNMETGQFIKKGL